MIRLALLDDWPEVKALWCRFGMGRHNDRIAGSFQQLETYFANSLTNPAIAFPLLFHNGGLKGLIVMHDSVEVALNDHGVLAPNPIVFIRMAVCEPIPRKSSRELHDFVMDWAKRRGANHIQGYCRMDAPLAAWTRLHGAKPLWVVMGKAVV